MDTVTATASWRTDLERTRAALLALEPVHGSRSWQDSDVMLYALGVGAGAEDPCREIALTTENSEGVELQVVPTFAIILVEGGPAMLAAAGVDGSDLLLMEEDLQLHEAIPTAGTVETETTVTAVQDHPRGLVVCVRSTATTEGRPLFDIASRTLVRRSTDTPRPAAPRASRPPAEQPPAIVPLRVAPNQGLLYRLSAGRNPLHSDPSVARRMGTRVPLLHGRCVLGLAARALVDGPCGGDATRLRDIGASFSRPVYPGDELELLLWAEDSEGAFEIVRPADGVRVVSRGRFSWQT